MLNKELKKAFKKHPTPITFRDLWCADQGVWRVQETDQPCLNELRRLALTRLIAALSDLFYLPAAAAPEVPAMVGMSLPDSTVLETEEINLKQIYYVWLMRKSVPILANRMHNINWFLSRNPKQKAVKWM